MWYPEPKVTTCLRKIIFFFFLNDTPTPEFSPLPLPDALPTPAPAPREAGQGPPSPPVYAARRRRQAIRAVGSESDAAPRQPRRPSSRSRSRRRLRARDPAAGRRGNRRDPMISAAPDRNKGSPENGPHALPGPDRPGPSGNPVRRVPRVGVRPKAA